MRKTCQLLVRHLGISGLIALPFIILISGYYLHLDFSYDEFFSFDNFIFVPFKKTVTDYGAPNNHILSSILHILFLKILGINDLFTLMDTPYKIRLLDLGFGLVTMGYVYRTGKRFFNEFVARLALLFLVTTIPFYNFVTLVRGYSLSMMLVSMVLYYTWSVEDSGRHRQAVLLVLLIPLLLYTIPLNIYFLLSLAGFYVCSFAWAYLAQRQFRSRKSPQRFGFFLSSQRNSERSRFGEVSRRHLVLLGLLCLGIALGTAIYVPFYKNFINNRHFKSFGFFYVKTLTEMLPQSLRYYLSERYLLLLLIGAGLACLLWSNARHAWNKERQKLICSCTLLLGPFVLSFIRGDHPPSRAFVNLVPVFVLTVALAIAPLQTLLRKRLYRQVALFVLLAYCYGSFAYGINFVVRPRLKADIEENTNRYDMYHNFFQAYYQPMKLVRYFMDHYPLDRIPITLVFNLQEYEMRKHLDKFAIRYYQHPYEVLFNQEGQAYVVVAFADTFVRQLAEFLPDVRCESVYPVVNYHKILLCESEMVRAQ